MRLLLVEDDADLGKSLKTGLEDQCFTVDWAKDGEKGSWLAKTNDYDLIILDNNLPGKQGREICAELREEGRSTPILVLTVQSDVQSKIDFLNLGADDYMAKPFSFGEVLARIHALLRRPPLLEKDKIIFDDLTIDLQKQDVRRGKEKIYLTRKEFQLLEYLLRNARRVVTRSMLLEHVWDLEADPFSNTIETHILHLRKKLEGRRKRKLIFTVPGRGYKVDTHL